MNKSQKSLKFVVKFFVFIFCCFISQFFCYFVMDDLLVQLIRPDPIFYIISRIVLVIIFYVISNAIYDKKINKLQIDIMFIFYLLFMLTLLFLKGNLYTASEVRINLNPLNIINDFQKSNNTLALLIGNIVMYIPYGMYFSYRAKNKKIFIVAMISIPILSELLQIILKVGVFDICDIILNAIGICSGIMIYNKIKKIHVISYYRRGL